MDLRIPHPDDANFPRILRGDPQTAIALELFREKPNEVAWSLALTAGYLRGAGEPNKAAAVLIALMTLCPETDFTT